jgi:hypothetical protein
MRFLLLLAACSAPLEVSVLDAKLMDGDVTIRVHYRDADGDLGGGSAEIQDCRAQALLTRLTLPTIASDAAVKQGVTIEGELDLVVTGVSVVTPDAKAVCGGSAPAKDQAVFCVTLVDHGGHRSAPSCTQSIAIQ